MEIRWLRHLAAQPAIDGLEPLNRVVEESFEQLLKQFDLDDAKRVKAIEAEINPRRQGRRIFFAERLTAMPGDTDNPIAFLHFACTSEDINNVAYGLMLRDARETVLLPRSAR